MLMKSRPAFRTELRNVISHRVGPMSAFFQALLAMLICIALTGCIEDSKLPIRYSAYNHTNAEIVSVVVNDKGGVLHAPARTGGAQVCCIALPKKWKPGMTVKIAWQLDGKWELDEQGHEIIRNGKRVLVPRPRKEPVVDVPKYTKEDLEQLDIHFVENRVELYVGAVYAFHPDYPAHLKLRKDR